MFRSGGAEICAAIRGYLVPLVGQALPDLFIKPGISSRVELVLYALSHGSRQAEWVAGANA
jgi:hypothetical protein